MSKNVNKPEQAIKQSVNDKDIESILPTLSIITNQSLRQFIGLYTALKLHKNYKQFAGKDFSNLSQETFTEICHVIGFDGCVKTMYNYYNALSFIDAANKEVIRGETDAKV